MAVWYAYTDGACRGNPGPSGAGVLLVSPNGEPIELKRFLGTATNNQAEYEALLLGLSGLIENQAEEVILRADSELMIRQMLGQYKVKSPHIFDLYRKAKDLSAQIKSIRFEHVRREFNKDADRLANAAIDEAQL